MRTHQHKNGRKKKSNDNRKNRKVLAPSNQVKKVFEEDKSDQVCETRLQSYFRWRLNIEWMDSKKTGREKLQTMKTSNVFSFMVKHIEGGNRDKIILGLSLLCIFLKGWNVSTFSWRWSSKNGKKNNDAQQRWKNCSR